MLWHLYPGTGSGGGGGGGRGGINGFNQEMQVRELAFESQDRQD